MTSIIRTFFVIIFSLLVPLASFAAGEGPKGPIPTLTDAVVPPTVNPAPKNQGRNQRNIPTLDDEVTLPEAKPSRTQICASTLLKILKKLSLYGVKAQPDPNYRPLTHDEIKTSLVELGRDAFLGESPVTPINDPMIDSTITVQSQDPDPAKAKTLVHMNWSKDEENDTSAVMLREGRVGEPKSRYLGVLRLDGIPFYVEPFFANNRFYVLTVSNRQIEAIGPRGVVQNLIKEKNIEHAKLKWYQELAKNIFGQKGPSYVSVWSLDSIQKDTRMILAPVRTFRVMDNLETAYAPLTMPNGKEYIVAFAPKSKRTWILNLSERGGISYQNINPTIYTHFKLPDKSRLTTAWNDQFLNFHVGSLTIFGIPIADLTTGPLLFQVPNEVLDPSDDH